MKATLKGTDWKTLKGVLESSRTRPAPIGNNTTAEWDYYNIVVRYHGNQIAKLTETGEATVTLAGWNTPTTRDRVNQFLPPGTQIRQINFEAVLCSGQDKVVISADDSFNFQS